MLRPFTSFLSIRGPRFALALAPLAFLAGCAGGLLPTLKSSQYLEADRNLAGVCAQWGGPGMRLLPIGSQPLYRCRHPYTMPTVAAPAPPQVEIAALPGVDPLLFAFDSATLTFEGEARLRGVADDWKTQPERSIQIDGFTDSTGPAEYNRRLSERRARAVRDFLVGIGLDPKRLVVSGHGESDPTASNATSAGRSQNRRTEIQIR